MKQTLISLKVVGFVRNDGEARSRKVVLAIDPMHPLIRSYITNRVLEQSLPEIHPGQGMTKYAENKGRSKVKK